MDIVECVVDDLDFDVEFIVFEYLMMMEFIGNLMWMFDGEFKFICEECEYNVVKVFVDY